MPPRTLASSTTQLRENLRRVRLSPRVRLAVRLYASGTMNQAEASKAAGLHPNYLGMLKTSGNKQVSDIIDQVDKAMADNLTDMGEIKRMLARRALRNLGMLMENADKEEIRFKAAQDLADRHSDTAKTTQVDVRGMIVKGNAKDLAAALVEAARIRGDGKPVGDFVHVADDTAKLPPTEG